MCMFELRKNIFKKERNTFLCEPTTADMLQILDYNFFMSNCPTRF